MTISIEIHNQSDIAWLQPLLERLLGEGNVKIHTSQPNNMAKFLDFTRKNAVKVQKVEVFNRDECNER